jgi:hypothetical protein
VSIYGVVLFHTTSAVMRAERLLIKGGYSVKLVPTPRQFSTDCGIALRFEWEHAEQVRDILARAMIETDALRPLGS